jgi:hypothetical protein
MFKILVVDSSFHWVANYRMCFSSFLFVCPARIIFILFRFVCNVVNLIFFCVCVCVWIYYIIMYLDQCSCECFLGTVKMQAEGGS